MSYSPTAQDVPVHVFGGPTTLIEYGGLRLLTDPTFDDPGEYQFTEDFFLVKTAPPSTPAADIGRIDAVLLSHDEHQDNLDTAGREFLSKVPRVLTTQGGADRLGGHSHGLQPWETAELEGPDGNKITVTATPALHGPEGSEPIVGEVIGFILTGQGLPTVYVSGDNASLDRVRRVADRFPDIDTAILFAGAAKVPFIDDILTLNGQRAADAAQLLDVRRVVPVHCDSWAHFSEGLDEIVTAFTDAGIADRLDVAR